MGKVMAQISILSWNVEHFNGRGGIDKNNRAKRADRIDRVVDELSSAKPDVFAISEVEGSDVFGALVDKMPNYTFNITEGRQSQEILIGVKSGHTAFFTQRNEFRRSNPHLRPGALLTIKKAGVIVPILFVHLKSMPSPEGFGLRDAMFDKIFNLKRSLDKATKRTTGDPANFVVVGDMNTMGMDYEGREHDIPKDEEVRIVTNRFRRRKMRRLTKSHDATFNNGSTSRYEPADLDHVFAAKHMSFKLRKGNEVHVGGWAEETDVAKRDAWIEEFSDHAPLSFTVSGL